MNIDEEWIAFILIMIGLNIMAFAIREWLRNSKQENRWED